MARGRPKKVSWFAEHRGGERLRQALARAVAANLPDADLAVLAAVFSLTVGWSKLDDSASLAEIATELGRWKRPDAGDTRTDEQIQRARSRVTDRIGRSLQRLHDARAVKYTPGRGGRLSRVELPEVADDTASQPHEARGVHTASQPHEARGVDRISTPRGAVLNPTRRGPQPHEARSSTPRPTGGTTDRSDRSDRTESGSIDPDAHASSATTHAGDRAADRLTSLAPVAHDLEQITREARRVVELAGRHVDVGVLLEALDDRDEPGTPAEILTWFADWIFFEGDSPQEEATGAALRAIAEVFPVATVIADACTVTSGKPWTAHFDEAVRLAQHWQRHAYPEGVTARVLDEIRHDGIRHPGNADELARQAILELGTTPPKKFARALASARKTA